MKTGRRRGRIQNGGTHQAPPEQRGPVVRPRFQRGLIDQPVLASGERVVENGADAPRGQSSHLIQIAEAIGKARCPAVASARRLGGFGQPDGLASSIVVTQRPVLVKYLVRTCKPV